MVPFSRPPPAPPQPTPTKPVRVDGLHVLGSPFEVDVSPGPARGANSTVSGPALALATAGHNASFVIQARDRESNPTADDEEVYAIQSAGGDAGAVFNVTLWRSGGYWEDGDNSTVVDASVEYIGELRCCCLARLYSRFFIPSCLHVSTRGC